MSKHDNWMPFYVGDYLADTMHLNVQQHGAYLLLLMHYWRNGPLPKNDELLAAIACRGDIKSWGKIWPTVSKFFVANGDGTLHQKRMDRERSKSSRISDERREAGRAGAEARHRRPKDEAGNCQAFASDLPAGLPGICKPFASDLPPPLPEVCHDFANVHLPSPSSSLSTLGEVCAREGSEPISGEEMANPAAAKAAWRDVVKAFTAKPPPYTPSVVFQLAALQPAPRRPQPQDPIRTPEEQLAILAAGD